PDESQSRARSPGGARCQREQPREPPVQDLQRQRTHRPVSSCYNRCLPLAQADLETRRSTGPQAVSSAAPLAADGKFLRVGDDRFLVKGVTYGTFAPDANGYQFPPLARIAEDFRLMADLGINTVRTYTAPTLELLDEAAKHGLRVMVGLPWSQH